MLIVSCLLNIILLTVIAVLVTDYKKHKKQTSGEYHVEYLVNSGTHVVYYGNKVIDSTCHTPNILTIVQLHKKINKELENNNNQGE